MKTKNTKRSLFALTLAFSLTFSNFSFAANSTNDEKINNNNSSIDVKLNIKHISRKNKIATSEDTITNINPDAQTLSSNNNDNSDSIITLVDKDSTQTDDLKNKIKNSMKKDFDNNSYVVLYQNNGDIKIDELYGLLDISDGIKIDPADEKAKSMGKDIFAFGAKKTSENTVNVFIYAGDPNKRHKGINENFESIRNIFKANKGIGQAHISDKHEVTHSQAKNYKVKPQGYTTGTGGAHPVAINYTNTSTPLTYSSSITGGWYIWDDCDGTNHRSYADSEGFVTYTYTFAELPGVGTSSGNKYYTWDVTSRYDIQPGYNLSPYNSKWEVDHLITRMSVEHAAISNQNESILSAGPDTTPSSGNFSVGLNGGYETAYISGSYSWTVPSVSCTRTLGPVASGSTDVGYERWDFDYSDSNSAKYATYLEPGVRVQNKVPSGQSNCFSIQIYNTYNAWNTDYFYYDHPSSPYVPYSTISAYHTSTLYGCYDCDSTYLGAWNYTAPRS